MTSVLEREELAEEVRKNLFYMLKVIAFFRRVTKVN